MSEDDFQVNEILSRIEKKPEKNIFSKKPIAMIEGKSDVYNFKVLLLTEKIKNFDFLKIEHQIYGYVLCQIFNISRELGNKLIGSCKIIGYRDKGILERIRMPFNMDCKIELAEDKFIEETIGLNRVGGALIGTLENHENLKIKINYKELLTRHFSILAKSGVGKSYTVGVILEEIMNLGVPILILDPHNEYSMIKIPNDKKEDIDKLNELGLKPQGFEKYIKEWSPDITINKSAQKISLNINDLTPEMLVNSLSQKLSPSQHNLLFNVLSNVNNRINFDELIFDLSNEESNVKWSLITLIEQLKKDKIYESNHTPLNELIKHNRCSIISLKGVVPRIQDLIVTNLLTMLFEARKKEQIPPFLLIVEEAHNFLPEKGIKSGVKSNEILRTISAEGRKFGLGLGIISQRPAKLDKNVSSQCLTQIIMKLTNSHDLKSVIASSEGLDSNSENEIQNLPVGTCMLTGIIDIPLKVKIRAKQSKHGGETLNVIKN